MVDMPNAFQEKGQIEESDYLLKRGCRQGADESRSCNFLSNAGRSTYGCACCSALATFCLDSCTVQESSRKNGRRLVGRGWKECLTKSPTVEGSIVAAERS